jgi:hypothetical protein
MLRSSQQIFLGQRQILIICLMGAYQVETNPPMQTMKTSVTATGSPSYGQRDRWEKFAKHHPSVPLLSIYFCSNPLPLFLSPRWTSTTAERGDGRSLPVSTLGFFPHVAAVVVVVVGGRRGRRRAVALLLLMVAGGAGGGVWWWWWWCWWWVVVVLVVLVVAAAAT